MRTLELFYTGTWFTSAEVPDDWEPTTENVLELTINMEKDNDFTDGGANWELHQIQEDDDMLWEE